MSFTINNSKDQFTFGDAVQIARKTEIPQIFNIDENIFCGVATNCCIYFPVKDSVEKGYKTLVLLDACRALTPESGEKAIEDMKNAGVVITTTSEVEWIA